MARTGSSLTAHRTANASAAGQDSYRASTEPPLQLMPARPTWVQPMEGPRRAVASLLASGHELAGWVPTHPTEREELGIAYNELMKFVGKTLFGGEVPGDIKPSQPTRPPVPPEQAGGMTRSEQMGMNHLVAFYREASPLMKTPQQQKVLVFAMHQVQNQFMGRIVRRQHPDYWTTIPGSLAADAQRENQRWGE